METQHWVIGLGHALAVNTLIGPVIFGVKNILVVIQCTIYCISEVEYH